MRDILKAGFKVGVATFASLLGWVVAGKILAMTLGAPGVGLFGILRQLLQNLTLLASFNGQAALVQGIASRSDRPGQLAFSGTVLKIQVIISVGVALALCVLAPWIGPRLIPHPQAVTLLRLLSLAMLTVVAQGYYVGVLNGHRMIDDLVKSQVLGPATTLVLVFPMIWLLRAGQPIAYVAMLGAPALVVSLAAARAVHRAGWVSVGPGWRIDREDGIGFIRMSLVLLVVGLVGTVSQFFMSWLVARKMGLAETGQFWAAWTLSMAYVTIFLSSFGTYYMPSLSSLANRPERLQLVRTYLRLSLLVMPLLVSIVIIFRSFVIKILFSADLLPAIRVMRWMLIGDFLKGVSWVLGLPMLAFGDMKWFFWSETLMNIGLALTSWIWLSMGGGIEGLGVLFLIMYAIHLPLVTWYSWLRLRFTWRLEELTRFSGGLCLVLALSFLSWHDQRVRMLNIASLLVLGALFLVLSLRGELAKRGWRLKARTDDRIVK